MNNLVDLDALGRIFYDFQARHTQKDITYVPITAAFDFEAALPSVIHKWIWLVLQTRRQPGDFLQLFKGLYHQATAVFSHGGTEHILIKFMSEVLQGCPGSAFLFNNSLDPFLVLFNRTLEAGKKGIQRACADDLAFALTRLKHLPLLKPIYDKAEQFAGLTLGAAKCIIIPLVPLSQTVIDKIHK